MSASRYNAVWQTRETEWRALMRLAQEGDKAAYSQLLQAMLPVLRGVVGRRWRNPQDVEDIVQDILLSVHGVRHTYDPGRAFMPWLMTIATRRIADAARTRSTRFQRETLVDVVPDTFVDSAVKSGQEHSDDQDSIRNAMASLSEAQREAIDLLKLQGLSLQEAAAITGKSVVSLKVSVHRAVKSMRQQLQRKQ